MLTAWINSRNPIDPSLSVSKTTKTNLKLFIFYHTVVYIHFFMKKREKYQSVFKWESYSLTLRIPWGYHGERIRHKYGQIPTGTIYPLDSRSWNPHTSVIFLLVRSVFLCSARSALLCLVLSFFVPYFFLAFLASNCWAYKYSSKA